MSSRIIHPENLYRAILQAQSAQDVPMDGIDFVDFQIQPAIVTNNLGSCSVVAITSEKGAILAHIPPQSPSALASDLFAGENHAREMMHRVRELYDNYARFGYFSTTPSNSHVVCAIFRGETALPEQLAIMQNTLRDMHLESATHTYNVPVDDKMPANGTVVVVSSRRPGVLPTVFVENKLVTKLDDMISRSALEEVLKFTPQRVLFESDTDYLSTTTSDGEQTDATDYTYPQYTTEGASHSSAYNQPAAAEATGTGQYMHSNEFSYYQSAMPVEADSAGYMMMDSYSYGQPSALSNTGGGMFEQSNAYDYQNYTVLAETDSGGYGQTEYSSYGQVETTREAGPVEYAEGQGQGMSYSPSTVPTETTSEQPTQGESSYSGHRVDALEPASTLSMLTVTPGHPLLLPTASANAWVEVSVRKVKHTITPDEYLFRDKARQTVSTRKGDWSRATYGGRVVTLWGLSILASNEMASASASSPPCHKILCTYNTYIGAPAEGTRRKAAPKASWMPSLQLAERHAAKQ